MRSVQSMLERALLLAIPERDRDCVLGDVNEEFGRDLGVERLWAIVRIAFHYHIEPYRNTDSVLPILIVAVLGVGMLWIIPIASENMFVDPEWLSRPLIRAAALVWGASHVTSALAVGLFVGRTTLVSTAVPVRWHISGAFCFVVILTTPGFTAGAIGAAVLLVSMWLGDAARRFA